MHLPLKLVVVTFTTLSICTLCSAVQIVDLSYTFNVDAPVSPTLSKFEHKVVKKGLNKYKVWLELNDFCTSEHAGTHLDSPVHFAKGKWSVEQIPAERLFRVPGVKIDLTPVSSSAPNYAIQPKDLEDWEAYYGVIPDGAVVLLETGWGKKSGNITDYAGVDEYKKYNFPGLGVPAAKWLASHGSRHGHSKGIIGVGIDTLSIDIGHTVEYPSHVVILKENIYALENVANMEKLPATDFLLTIMPVKIGGGSGAPARIIAETSDYDFSSARATTIPSKLASFLTFLKFFVFYMNY